MPLSLLGLKTAVVTVVANEAGADLIDIEVSSRFCGAALTVVVVVVSGGGGGGGGGEEEEVEVVEVEGEGNLG